MLIDLSKISLVNIAEFINRNEIIFAHVSEDGKEPETLLKHSQRTIKYFDKLVNNRGLNKVFNNFTKILKINGNELCENQIEFLAELFVNAIYLHDMGKLNIVFQIEKMKNSEISKKNNSKVNSPKHSMLSALIYIDVYYERIKFLEDKHERRFFYYVLLIFSYAISRHHSSLNDFNGIEYLGNNLKDWIDKIRESNDYVEYYTRKDSIVDIMKITVLGKSLDEGYMLSEFYFLSKLLYSCIVVSDFYATGYYDTGEEPDIKGIENVEEIYNCYSNTDIIKGIRQQGITGEYFKEDNINYLRCKMFDEAEECLLKNLNNANVFYLEAPTGSGKTNTSINLALNITKKLEGYNKIVYVFPFNTLAEQTKEAFEKTFEKVGDFKPVVINSITPIVTEKELKGEDDYEDVDYKRDYLNRQMLHYPLILTSHVNFFNYLFGIGREANLPYVHFCNSIIIMDEIQSYKNKIWAEIIEHLDKFSMLFNVKIIIMSATLPRLDLLLREERSTFCELIKNKWVYYSNRLFKDRVKLNFELLEDNNISYEKLIEKIEEVLCNKEECRVLIEFIKKTSARDFYQKVKYKFTDRQIFELTGDDSNLERRKVLAIINAKDDNKNFICKNLIVVATQVIEAGVDIDMDIGFKDISLLDGEEQFLGRINRSCLRDGCIVYFFNLDAASKIYKNDKRLEFDLLSDWSRAILENKDFGNYYEKVIQRIKEEKSEAKDSILNYEDSLKMLSFKELSEKMKLIDNENYQVFLSREIILSNGEKLDGNKIWEDYKLIINDKKMEYSKKMITLSELSEKISYFTYNYVDNSYDKRPKMFDEFIGMIYFVRSGDRYIIDGNKFDRKKFQEAYGGMII